jgi:GntR family transcriptional regulator
MHRVVAFRKEQFLENELPLFLRSMYLLDIPMEEIEIRYMKFIDKTFKEKKYED